MQEKPQIQFARRMSQLPPYLFGMINKMKMESAGRAMMSSTWAWAIPLTRHLSR